MISLAITSQTWMVTLLGFGIVLILLTCFVFIMKGLGAIMQLIEKKPEAKAQKAAPVYAKDADGATNAAIAVSLDLAQGDEDKAAVAFALNLYYGVHDIDNCRITLVSRPTAWNSKTIMQ